MKYAWATVYIESGSYTIHGPYKNTIPPKILLTPASWMYLAMTTQQARLPIPTRVTSPAHIELPTEKPMCATKKRCRIPSGVFIRGGGAFGERGRWIRLGGRQSRWRMLIMRGVRHERGKRACACHTSSTLHDGCEARRRPKKNPQQLTSYTTSSGLPVETCTCVWIDCT